MPRGGLARGLLQGAGQVRALAAAHHVAAAEQDHPAQVVVADQRQGLVRGLLPAHAGHEQLTQFLVQGHPREELLQVRVRARGGPGHAHERYENEKKTKTGVSWMLAPSEFHWQ